MGNATTSPAAISNLLNDNKPSNDSVNNTNTTGIFGSVNSTVGSVNFGSVNGNPDALSFAGNNINFKKKFIIKHRPSDSFRKAGHDSDAEVPKKGIFYYCCNYINIISEDIDLPASQDEEEQVRTSNLVLSQGLRYASEWSKKQDEGILKLSCSAI